MSTHGPFARLVSYPRLTLALSAQAPAHERRCDGVASRQLALRRPDCCSICERPLDAGVPAWWDAAERQVVCLGCHAGEGTHVVLDRGRAGASAAREYERRKARREAATRAAHPVIGDVLLAFQRAPRHETAFRQGAGGEVAVADSLEQRVAGGPTILLHDRRMPGGRGNIDHLAVAPTGVFVIDAKDWSGTVRIRKPLLGAPKLLIAGRDRTCLIDGLDRQVTAVALGLGRDSERVAMQGVLCFTKADLPLVGVTRMRGHLLLYRKALAKRLNAPGSLRPEDIQVLARHLASAFPSA